MKRTPTVRQKIWRTMLSLCFSLLKRSTLELLIYRQPRADILDRLMIEYVRKAKCLQHLSRLAYNETLPRRIRLLAGHLIIQIGQEDAWHFLPDSLWSDPETGRTAYMICTVSYLPELAPDLLRAVPKLWQIEQQIVMNHFPAVGSA